MTFFKRVKFHPWCRCVADECRLFWCLNLIINSPNWGFSSDSCSGVGHRSNQALANFCDIAKRLVSQDVVAKRNKHNGQQLVWTYCKSVRQWRECQTASDCRAAQPKENSLSAVLSNLVGTACTLSNLRLMMSLEFYKCHPFQSLNTAKPNNQ